MEKSKRVEPLQIFDELPPVGLFRCHAALVDITGDMNAAILLSQIIYWFSPSDNGRPKLRVYNKSGQLCLAKKRSEWYEEIRLKERQVDTAIQKLIALGLVTMELGQFARVPTPFISLNIDTLRTMISKWRDDQTAVNPYSPKQASRPDGKGEIDLTASVKSTTEITSEITSKIKINASRQSRDATPSSQLGNDERNIMAVRMVLQNGKIDSTFGPDDIIEFVEEYLGLYKWHMKRQHPVFRWRTWAKILSGLSQFSRDAGDFPRDIDIDDIKTLSKLAGHYFETDYSMPVDRSIAHFLTNGIIVNLYYHHCY